MNAIALAPGIKGYTQWRKALWADPELRNISTGSANHIDLRSVAELIALYGANGRGSTVSIPTVAAALGRSDRAVKTARRTLIGLGWFTVAGKGGYNGRSDVLNISVPTPVLVLDLCARCGRPMTPGRAAMGQADCPSCAAGDRPAPVISAPPGPFNGASRPA